MTLCSFLRVEYIFMPSVDAYASVFLHETKFPSHPLFVLRISSHHPLLLRRMPTPSCLTRTSIAAAYLWTTYRTLASFALAKCVPEVLLHDPGPAFPPPAKGKSFIRPAAVDLLLESDPFPTPADLFIPAVLPYHHQSHSESHRCIKKVRTREYLEQEEGFMRVR